MQELNSRRFKTVGRLDGFCTATLCLLLLWVARHELLAADKKNYEEHIVPILRNQCFNCHNSDKKKADLDVSTYNGILAGGGSGPALVSGDPGASLLWKLINHLEEPSMPPRAPKLSDADLAVIKEWIEGGLLENQTGKAVVAKKPQTSLAVKSVGMSRPEGPPPMPNEHLLLEPTVRPAKPGAITALAASPWAPLIALAGQRQVFLYNSDSLDLLGILPFPDGFPYVLRFSQNARILLVGGGIGAKSGKVTLYDVVTGRKLSEAGDEHDAVLAADLSPDQSRVALGGPSKVIRIYSTSSGELIHTIKKHTDWVTSVAYSPDGVLLATADRAGAVHVWEAGSAQPYNELKAHQQPVTDLAWRDDSNLLATAGEDGQIMLWELENATRVKNWAAHPGGALALRFSHDGQIVSAGRDRVAKQWDVNGTQVRAFEALPDIILSVAVTHDSSKLITADYTGQVSLWTIADGKSCGKLDANPPLLGDRIAVDTKLAEELKGIISKLDLERSGILLKLTNLSVSTQNARSNAAAAETALTLAANALAAAQKARTDSAASVEAAQKDLVQLRQELDAAQLASRSSEQLLSRSSNLVQLAREALTTGQVARDNSHQAWLKTNAALELDPQNTNYVAAVSQTRAVLDSATAGVLALEKNLKEAEVSLKAAEEGFQTSTKALVQLQQKVTEHESLLASLTKGQEQLAQAAKFADDQLLKAKADALAGSAVVASSEAEHSKVTASLSDTEVKLSTETSKLTSLNHRVSRWRAAQLNAELLALGEQVTIAQSKADVAAAEAAAAKAASDALAGDLTRTHEEVSAGPSVLAGLQQQASVAEAELAQASQALTALQNKVTEVEKRAAAASCEFQKAQVAHDATKKLLEQFQARAAEIGTNRDNTAAAAEHLRALLATAPDLSQLSTAAEKLTRVAEEFRAAGDLTGQALAVVQGRLDAQTQDLSGKAKAHADALLDLTSTKDLLSKQPGLIAQTGTRLENARKSAAEMQARLAALPQQLQKLRSAQADAARIAVETQSKANSAAARLSELKAKEADLSSRYASATR